MDVQRAGHQVVEGNARNGKGLDQGRAGTKSAGHVQGPPNLTSMSSVFFVMLPILGKKFEYINCPLQSLYRCES